MPETDSDRGTAAGDADSRRGLWLAMRRFFEGQGGERSLRRELEDKLVGQRLPYARGEAFGVNDLIDPRETRPVLCDWAQRIRPMLREHTGPSFSSSSRRNASGSAASAI